MDSRPDLSAIFEAFGVPGVVTVSGEEPVETTVVWMSSETQNVPGGDYDRKEEVKVLAIGRADMPQGKVPHGTRVVAPEVLGGPNRTWKVDGFERSEPDLVRTIVIDVTED